MATVVVTGNKRKILEHLEKMEMDHGGIFFVMRRMTTPEKELEMLHFLEKNPQAKKYDIIDKAFLICDLP